MENQESKFGFTQFAETWNGRLAMLGFVIGLATELLTGQGILSQLGLMQGSNAILWDELKQGEQGLHFQLFTNVKLKNLPLLQEPQEPQEPREPPLFC